MPLRIDLRDKRLPGPKHRLNLSADTENPAERDARLEAVRKLLDLGERGLAIIERLRTRDLTVAEVAAAVTRMDLASLERPSKRAKPKGVQLGATVDRFLLKLEGTDKSPRTIDSYRQICAQMEAAFGVVRDEDGEIVEDVQVGPITSQECEAWLHGPKERAEGDAWSARTQRKAHSVAAQVWDLALIADEEHAEQTGAERTVLRNPFRNVGARKGVRPPRIKQTRAEFLTRSQAAKLLWTLRGYPHAAWCAVGIYAGLRAGEAAHLRIGTDIDFDRNRLRIQGRKGQHEWRTKSDRSTRDVPIHPALRRFLKQHIRKGYAGKTFLFRPAGQDRPLAVRTRVTWTEEAFKAGGVKYGRKKGALTHHSMRHTFASWLTMADVHPLKIAELMGDTVEQVMGTYAHLIDRDLEAAIHRL